MASDGLFDNVFDDGVKDCLVGKVKREKLVDVDGVSNCLAKKAEDNGKLKDFESPFYFNARASGEEKFANFPAVGKQDDITIIVAQVERRTEGSDIPLPHTNGFDSPDTRHTEL